MGHALRREAKRTGMPCMAGLQTGAAIPGSRSPMLHPVRRGGIVPSL